ncbi:lipocalin family protein [Mucilaginibacter agri]|uniref:Lipocalin-like domain-containing protein n=1 Tax=Mucilaginibacter agri TaxID=2695265 RepID=A0A965ZIF7_9SPHI|nr:lipocalin family protein [Mucilaginibacter agri]NCD70723.1 hypothetical protein [Mucilaginibacter agri]
MKKTLIVLIVAGLTILTVNSCKKDNQDSISNFLTVSPWQLASVQVSTYVGSSLIETDTLNTNCSLKQTFTFSTDKSCSYQNFICRDTTNKGTWALSDDKLTLNAAMVCRDTVTGGRDTTDSPFRNAQIVSLGGYSLVLQTGDVNSYYTSTQTRVIKRWGFIHQ